MTISNTNNVISINITKFPQNLLIPSIDNVIKFQATNHSNKKEDFSFVFEGENLNVVFPGDLKKFIEFNSGETKEFELRLTPISDGFGKFTIDANIRNKSQHAIKTQRVRDFVSQSRINEIFVEHALDVSETHEDFKIDDFLISMTNNELKQAEEELESKRTNPEITSIDIDNDIKRLAKGYLSNYDLNKALDLALRLSNENEKLDFSYALIRAYSFMNIDTTLQYLADSKVIHGKKFLKLLQDITLDQVNKNLDNIFKIIHLIKNPTLQENLLINIICIINRSKPKLARKLCNLIENELSRCNILFNIARKLYQNDEKSDLSTVLNEIIEIITNSTKISLSENKYNNRSYNYLKDAVRAIAEVDSPKTADSIINGINVQELKEKIAMDLLNILYEIVDEIKFKYEPTLIFSQYYLLNTYTSGLNENVKYFAAMGGNVSNNLLVKNYDFNVAFISLFKLDFSIFPIFDRAYSDLKFNLNKSFAYYIYPSSKNHDEREKNTILSTLQQFFNPAIANSQMLIINTDFIPYLGKPTVIISSEPEISNYIITKISKSLGNSAALIVDDSFFKGGATVDYLRKTFPIKCNIVNMILSYEFVNDYNIFKTLIESIV